MKKHTMNVLNQITALLLLFTLLTSVRPFSFVPIRPVCNSRNRLYATDGQDVDICIIGGGISGLAAAITAAEKTTTNPPSITLLESDTTIGGRVRSDYTSDGYILDRGFAVFIEEYPTSKQLLDYESLKLEQFLPGARVKLSGRDGLAAVSDPLRRRRDLWKAISSPVGSLKDKLRLAPLFYTVVTKSIDELFAMEETDTLTCLRNYRFSESFIESFFAPFFEGIYLVPLEKQSSRMFHFVFKMFAVGAAALPNGGMQAVADQLGEKALKLGVRILCGRSVESIQQHDGKFVVKAKSDEDTIQLQAKGVVLATNEKVARHLLCNTLDLDQRQASLPELSQRTVACLYYSLPSPPPLVEPILILNGEGSQQRNTKGFPVNNVCFPSVIQASYSPQDYDLCSVSVLENALNEYNEDYDALDRDVRRQLSTWFPNRASDIMDASKWIAKGQYVIKDAQPSHYKEPSCANVHGGRDCAKFCGETLPKGMFVCGDYIATSTFNGALESGVNAGKATTAFLKALPN